MVESDEGRLLRVTGSVDRPPNRGKLCAKGWLGLDLLASEERLTTPLVRRDGRLVETGWDEALEAAVDGLRRAAGRDRAVVALGSGRLSCEDRYLLQRLVRCILGSPHVSMAAVGGCAHSSKGWHRWRLDPDRRRAWQISVMRPGGGASGGPTRTHPLVKTELVQGIRGRRQRLVLCHSLSGGLERHAD